MTTNPVNVLVLTSPISLVEIVPRKGFVQCRRERVAFDYIPQRVASTKPGPDHGPDRGPDHGPDRGPDRGPDHGSDHTRKKLKKNKSVMK